MRRFLISTIAIIITNLCFAQTEETKTAINFNGQAITTIDHKTITQNFGRSLAQLLNDQPGIVVNGAYQPSGTLVNVYMEGTVSGRTLILINDIPVSDPASLPEYFDLNTITLYEIERIEIYHGTQSTLMGNGALAGAINIITIEKDSTGKKFQAHALQSIGNQNTINTSLHIQGSIDKWKYAVSYSRHSTNGFSYALDSIGNQNFDKDGFTSNYLNASLSFNPNKYNTIKAYCLYTQYKADTDYDGYSDAVGYYYNDKQIIAGTGWTYKNKKSIIAANLQYTSNTRNYHFDDFSYDIYRGLSNFGELYTQTAISRHFTLLLGTDFRHNFMHNDFFDSNFGLNPHYYPAIDMYSGFGKLSYTSKDSILAIDAAERWSHHASFGSLSNYNISGSYKLTKKAVVIFGIASGYKAPCIFQLYNNYGFSDSALTPEKTTQYHVGITLKDKKLKQTFRAFYSSYKDLIYFQYDIGMYTNFSTQQTWGLQYDMEYNIGKSWKITANYAYVDGSDYSKNRTNYTDTTMYPYLYRRPQHVVNFGMHYFNSTFSLGVTGRYVGDYHEIGFEEPEYIMPHFFVMNAYSTYRVNEHWKVFANVQNLLNNTFYDVKGYNSIPFLLNAGFRFQL